ncbi:MAG: PSD1 domain-containing protein [Pirellulaceae bacterium]|nr:PSD1 domain-containing protein [Pirellulaceae bacterium]
MVHATVIANLAGQSTIDFVAQIRPILQSRCYDCHSQQQAESGLRLDIKATAMRGGDHHGVAIFPGNPSRSPLVELISSSDSSRRMPPDEPLSDAEIQTIIRWIAEGANWPDGVDTATLPDKTNHWSFKPLTEYFEFHSIDQFIDQRLAEHGLQRSQPASPAQWLRRATLDLTGLLPEPEEIQRFAAQAVPDYAAQVERLLGSPTYGQRWAQHWLDVVRYADTHGFEVNTERPNAWPYRDYVIRAANADVPYDQFIRHQLCGDALGEDAATGFLITASVLLPGQIGKDAPSMRLARQDAIDEIVNNIGQTFLALSIGCARCHDHKFDPITSVDYYAMQAFVAGVEYEDRELGGLEASAPSGQMVFAGKFRAPDNIHLLNRGDPEQPLQPVSPAVIRALADVQLDDSASEQHRRQVLADWIANPLNPLTARVIVNRIWQSHFGVGLVETPGDFGHGGLPPSHPELLDWLAAEFIRSGWSVKALHRLIMLSATYQQSSHAVASLLARALPADADGRLLWRYPSRRLDAEVIRDSMLQASGQLNLTMSGPGFDLFEQRGGLSGFTPIEELSAANSRRMIYAHRVRREREAVFGVFDCPDGGQSTQVRRESTTPLQALNLLNSSFTMQCAQALARRVSLEAGDDTICQIQRAFWLTLSRPATDDEISEFAPLVQQHGMMVLCRALFNSNEFLNLP